jgi:aminoglycoside phosphotransferase (APT) family kinase protein
MMKSFLEELSTLALDLSDEGQPRFAPPLHWVALGNGDADFHDNMIFFGFDTHRADPRLVAKAPRLSENSWMLQREHDRLADLWGCMGEAAADFVPRPYAIASIQDRSVLMISYIPGESLTRLPPRSFWGKSENVRALATEAARALRELNRLTASPVRAAESPGSGFSRKVAKFKELFQTDAAEDRALADLTALLEEQSRSASYQVIVQGDFWHGNMIRRREGGRLMFVDWQFAHWSVDVSLDVYFFLLAGALSAAGHGPADESAALAFAQLASWRAEVLPEYLAAYGRPAGYILLPQKYGMMLCCVEKAVRSALAFGYSHPDDLVWRYLFSKLMDWPSDP